MSKKHQNLRKSKTRIITVSVEDLQVCPHNPRKSNLDLGDLTESVKKNGIKEHIEVHPHSNGWHVIAGQRRFEAAKKAGIPEVECLEYPLDEKQAEDWCMHDAFHKKDYDPLDISNLVTKAVEKYGSLSKVNKQTGISESKLKKYYGMRGLSEGVRERIESSNVKKPAVEILRKISNLPENRQLETYELIIGKTRDDANEILKKLNGSSTNATEVTDPNEAATMVILVGVTQETYAELAKKAANANTTMEKLCRKTIEDLVLGEPNTKERGK